MNHVHSDRVRSLGVRPAAVPFVLLEEPLFYKRIYEQSALCGSARANGVVPARARADRGYPPSPLAAGRRLRRDARAEPDGDRRTGQCAPWNSSGAFGTCGATWPSMRWTACGWRPAGGRHGDVATTAESPRHRMTLEASSSEPKSEMFFHVVAAPSRALIRGVVTDNLRSVDRLRWYPSLLLEGSDRDAEQRRLADEARLIGVPVVTTRSPLGRRRIDRVRMFFNDSFYLRNSHASVVHVHATDISVRGSPAGMALGRSAPDADRHEHLPPRLSRERASGRNHRPATGREAGLESRDAGR